MSGKTIENVSENVVECLRQFLGEKGCQFFQEIYEQYGHLCAVWAEDGSYGSVSVTIPHAVHFREGMQVRNFLRGLPECEDWDDHDFDDLWESVVLLAIGIADK